MHNLDFGAIATYYAAMLALWSAARIAAARYEAVPAASP
jgi:hypothetical protein